MALHLVTADHSLKRCVLEPSLAEAVLETPSPAVFLLPCKVEAFICLSYVTRDKFGTHAFRVIVCGLAPVHDGVHKHL
jgi:hypothetical protein